MKLEIIQLGDQDVFVFDISEISFRAKIHIDSSVRTKKQVSELISEDFRQYIQPLIEHKLNQIL